MPNPLFDELIKRAVQEQVNAAPAPAPAAQPAPQSKGMVLPHAIYLGGAAADIGSTLYSDVHPELGLAEGNPLLKGLPRGMEAPVGAGIELLGYLLARKLLKDKHPNIFKAGLIGAGIAHGAAAANNIRMMKDGK